MPATQSCNVDNIDYDKLDCRRAGTALRAPLTNVREIDCTMKYLLAFAAPVLIALCLVGLVAAQSPAAPTGVTVVSAADGIRVSWDADDAPAHRVGWVNTEELAQARAAGNWLDAFNSHDVTDGNSYLIPSLPDGAGYWVIVGSGNASPPTEIAWDEWRLITVEHVTDTTDMEEAITEAYVRQAIAYYQANGRSDTVAHYRSEAGVADGRSLTLLDADTGVLLVYHVLPTLQDQYVGPGSTFSGFQEFLAHATAEGAWITARAINPATKQEEPRRIFVVLHGGLVFISSHSALVENVAASTQEYVNRAIKYYDDNGLDATIAYYDSQDSLEGQFYLFLIGADDNYLAHPIFPHLKGTDIKDVEGSDGQELGEEIAQATEAGIWVEYLWPHPVTRKEQQKVTWAVRHHGLIFASGYYAGVPETGDPPWRDADPREYTVQYVNRAIARYERDGLESMLNYYNSVASFEGEWYLFATDENDVYHVHPLIPGLIGTDIKNVVGSDGRQLGRELAKAVDGGKGVWVEYLWPHPVTLQEVPKVGYAVRKDGMIFASGYYPQVADPAGRTQEYVQQAIGYYKANGLDATIAHYNSDASLDGQWSLTLADANDMVRVAILSPRLVGTDLKDLGKGPTRQIGEELAAATEAGIWVSHVFPNTRSSETLYAHNWAIRYDGLLFMSRYYDDRPGSPEPAETADDRLTREYVERAIAYYNEHGLAAAIEYYNNPASREGERMMLIIDPAQSIALAWGRWPTLTGTLDTATAAALFASYPTVGGQSAAVAIARLFKDIAAAATPEGGWIEYQTRTLEGFTEPSRNLVVLHDGLVFSAGHFGLVEKYREGTQQYVTAAIARYEQEGREATIAHYNSRDSMDEQYYLFLIGADDLYLAHPIFPHLIGTDIKDVVASNGYELGKEIAKATADGHWIYYLWPNPVTNREEPKTTWAIRHDGLVFASGYYTAADDAEPPAWLDADPREYTVAYVERAIERYERDGRDAMVTYYNSVSAFEGEWYLFATDANDIYVVHPLLSHLIGTDIKDVVGSDGYELGKEIAKATEEGHWIDYLWPHPVTLFDANKSTYAVRHDGMIFASGYYPVAADAAAQTIAFVQAAIDYYAEHGREAMVAYYSDDANLDGVQELFLLDETGAFAPPSSGNLAGLNANVLAFPDFAGNLVGPQMANAPEEGRWLNFSWPGTFGSNNLISHTWVIRYDGLVFMASYFDDKTYVSGAN